MNWIHLEEDWSLFDSSKSSDSKSPDSDRNLAFQMGVSSSKSGKISRVFIEALASAVLEWLLLFLLFLNAIIAYVVTKFARGCGLQTPCLLCSRLDHILGNEKSGYYWDMICGTHKLEISALAICNAHSNHGHIHEAMKIMGGGYFDHLSNRGIGNLPPVVGYTEPKKTSDAEAGVFMFSDDDGTGVLVPGQDRHVSLDFATLKTPAIVPIERADIGQDSAVSSPFLSRAKVDPEADQVIGNVDSGTEIGLKEMNLGSSEIKNDKSFVDELVFFEKIHSLVNEVVGPEKPSPETCAAEANESAEADEVVEKVETDPIPTLEKSSEEKIVSIETNQENPSISKDRENQDSESPSHDPVTESSLNTLRHRVSFHNSQEVSSISNDRESQDSESQSHDHVIGSSRNTLSRRVSFHNWVIDELSGRKLDEVTIPNSSSSNGLDTHEKNESEDGEIERMKRQIEEDKQALHELQKELEEERNAAAISANEAMAMITRLQDEKANLRMDAQQYLRMMEEQAEYDMDALQKSNDLLVEREMEIQDLEEELESYRKNEPFPENINDSLLCIEDERVQLQQYLKKLEENLRVRVSSKNPSLANGECNGNGEINSDSPKKDSLSGSKGVDVDSFANELSSMQERLEKLETDRVFIERAIKYLRIGDEGLFFIQDLASHLQELRNNQLYERNKSIEPNESQSMF